MHTLIRAFVLVAASGALLVSCGGGGESGTGASTGQLTVAVTDAPVDNARKVFVTFTAVEVKPEGGPPVTYDIPDRQIDLLALAGGNSESLLQNQTVPAGRYQWLRLLIQAQQNTMSSYIELNTGAQYPLYVPSGEERGLQLIRGFTVAQGGRTDFTIDFDLRRSVIAPRGQAPNYMLKPVLRIVDSLQVGTVVGTVPASLIPTGCTPFIYVFQGSNVTPDDIDPADDVDPLVSIPVTLDTTTGTYRFRIPFMEAGAYTAAFTCDGALDTPDGEETLVFSPGVNFTLNANQTLTLTL